MARTKSSSKASSTAMKKKVKKAILPMGKMIIKSKIKAHYQVISELSNNRYAGEDNASEIGVLVADIQKLEAEYRLKYSPGLVEGDYHPSAFVSPPTVVSVSSYCPTSPKGVSVPNADFSMYQSTRL